jgi:hypothetical protein
MLCHERATHVRYPKRRPHDPPPPPLPPARQVGALSSPPFGALDPLYFVERFKLSPAQTGAYLASLSAPTHPHPPPRGS